MRRIRLVPTLLGRDQDNPSLRLQIRQVLVQQPEPGLPIHVLHHMSREDRVKSPLVIRRLRMQVSRNERSESAFVRHLHRMLVVIDTDAFRGEEAQVHADAAADVEDAAGGQTLDVTAVHDRVEALGE